MTKTEDRRKITGPQNLAKVDNTKHGFYKYLTLSAEKYPEPIKAAYQQRYGTLMALDHIDPELDAGAVAQVCRFEVVLDQLYEWLMQHRLVNKKGKHQPILNVLAVFENSLNRYYDRLGLTPDSRKRIGLKKRVISWADALSEEEGNEPGSGE